MKRLNRFALNLGITLILSAASVSAAPGRNAEQWPLWEKFCSSALSEDGRIIDAGDPRQITTSEGQSYALFFALAAMIKSASHAFSNGPRAISAQGTAQSISPLGCGEELRNPLPRENRREFAGTSLTATTLQTLIYGWLIPCLKPAASGNAVI